MAKLPKDRCDPEHSVAAFPVARIGAASPARVAGAACTTCGRTGKLVETRTVQALLALPLTEMRGDTYRFCAQSDCPTVYYSSDGAGGAGGAGDAGGAGGAGDAGDAAGQPGQHVFLEADLRERVHQKHPADDEVFVCYCFRHTPGSIRAELRATGHSTVVQRVTAGIKAERCACEIRNPQGSCCLGNVRAVMKQLASEPMTMALAGSGPLGPSAGRPEVGGPDALSTW